jgi:hypothetical protein
MFEPHHQPLLSRAEFALRILRSLALAIGVVVVSLGIGACGYHTFAELPWLDATLNAAMILTGMGPVDPMRTSAAKLFATFYALFSGVVFLTMASVILAPILHRFLHRFHLEESAKSARSNKKAS